MTNWREVRNRNKKVRPFYTWLVGFIEGFLCAALGAAIMWFLWGAL